MIYFSEGRFDIQYVVRRLAQWISKPRRLDELALKHLLKYLKGTKDWVWCFFYQPRPKGLSGFSDSDWAQDPVT